jgi:SAM-dependent methyltransferase
MRRRVSVVCAVAVLMALALPAASAQEHPHNVILIGWDGAQRNHVNECLEREELPNLQELIDRGKYVKIDVEGTADTKAGWSEILTGYAGEVTGVYSDAKYQPVPKGMSVFERLEAKYGTGDFVTAAVIGESEHCACAPGAPFANVRPAVEVWESGLVDNARVGARTLELLETYKEKPFFFFVQFNEATAAGAEAGENSKAYNDALVSDDLWTGRIVDRVAELGLGDATQFYVTADHGFDEGGRTHASATEVFLVTTNKAVRRDGRRQDIAPTFLEDFHVDVEAIEPRLRGSSLTRVPDILWVPTPQIVVDKMLEMAKVTKDDIVYDLGCGDGIIVATAAKRYGCKAWGFDIDPNRIRDSLAKVDEYGVGDLVTIELRDIFTLDLSKASVVTLYLLPSLNVKLIPQLEKLKPGSRIVSHDFDMRGVIPDQVVRVTEDGGLARPHTVYFWTTPLKKEQDASTP